MDIKNKEQFDLFAFYWTEARLLIASVALFMGGVSPIFLVTSTSSMLVMRGLTISWILSGFVSIYLIYRWFENDKKVFDGKDTLGIIAFFVSVVTGLNLGIAGVWTNIGMEISNSPFVFWVTGIIYIASAWYLFMKWNDNGKKLF